MVQECDICQQHKGFTTLPAGLLQPLPIPEQAWTDINMDFISGLPKYEGREVILVVVDIYTKYKHFLALSHPYTATTVAKVMLDSVIKLNGIPKIIVSDRDNIFLRNFWQCLLTRLGTSLHLSTAYHPQTDGQTERTQVVGHMLKGVLEEAQHKIKQQADKKRIEREFKEGDWVYLRLQPYRQTSMQLRKNLKLAAKFFFPYKILERIGKLKAKLGSGKLPQTTLPKLNKDQEMKVTPLQILDSRQVKKGKHNINQVLVQWENLSTQDATWEDKEFMAYQFPKLILEVKDLKE
ncbi:uncharacterized protein LOC113324450 [Papaver somniferum]|uniref:uncharacterized protein LOC113324450 n=1 Tax=Papaver somniferum TaxID=3469 RepID=UPI000E6F7028|nr:uncharacterized protein LOC113324450 [Papaver somniferum]